MEPKNPTIHELYPHLTDEECKLAEDNLEQYLALALRIFERLESEAEANQSQFTLAPEVNPSGEIFPREVVTQPISSGGKMPHSPDGRDELTVAGEPAPDQREMKECLF